MSRSRSTVGNLLDEWFAHASPDFSPSTVKETRGTTERYLKPTFGATDVAKLRTDDIDRFYRSQREGKSKSGQPLKSGTIRRMHVILRRALAQGVKWGWIRTNPVAAASPPRVPVGDIVPPSPADLGRLFVAGEAHDPTLATFVVLAAATGARRSELMALRRSDFDWMLVGSGSSAVWCSDRTATSRRTRRPTRHAALDPRTIEVVRAHRRRALELAMAVGVQVDPSGYVFAADAVGREHMRPDSVSRSFRRVQAQAGANGARLHDLRHYVATQLLTAGVDVRTVAGRLGHRSASTTLNVYAHFLPEADRAASEVLASLLPTPGARADGTMPMSEGLMVAVSASRPHPRTWVSSNGTSVMAGVGARSCRSVRKRRRTEDLDPSVFLG
ncbi:MAG: tyrosine-type recombinase/integrase [Actinomycetota bacterium]|nr:tyrosine-type recombinase/integrase [Actinomycetota bacterium]